MIPQRNRARVAALLLGVATLAACASAPLPEEQIALSKSSVNRAVSADATQYAPLEMKSAQDKLLLLERAVGEGDAVQSRRLAEQVEVDANLAEGKANAVKWQQQLEASRKGIQVLKQEMLNAPDATFDVFPDDSL
ncbi:MAG: hypothetical protein JWR17_3035 [Pseudomonas sp.]|jgi:ABC-type uncharacterized transport system auxiliary subunit|uniref:DUF4398 domain-containing protein n=1 Tax=Pseudomonas sp. TaxID=306 RepID=UPI00261378B1|nr:DUF4398 domain-containing protein [Pseudomonas sp.]MDB6050289.1 hypothetical protein [Pseudomonas sp.]